MNRQFHTDRPNALWASDFTYVSTWQGWGYVAFTIDVSVRRIVGWKVYSSSRSDFVLDAVEQALYARRREADEALIHHSDRGVRSDSMGARNGKVQTQVHDFGGHCRTFRAKVQA